MPKLWPSRRRPAIVRNGLDCAVTRLYDRERRVWQSITLRQLLEHELILGGTGSGKTSGSGQLLALSLLRLGFGFVVHTVKGDELMLWGNYNDQAGPLGYCARAGIKRDRIIVVGPRVKLYRECGLSVPDGGHCLNLLDAEFKYHDQHDPLSAAASVAYICCTAIQPNGDRGAHLDPYWADAVMRLGVMAVELCICACGSVKLDDLCEVIRTAPRSRSQAWSARWRAKSLFWNTFVDPAIRRTPIDHIRHRDLAQALNYFLVEFAELAERTRSVIVSSFMSKLTPLTSGSLRSSFAGDRPDTCALEETHQGRIFLVDLPIKLFGESGAIGQKLLKTAWQRATERRDARAAGSHVVVLWADEAQELITSHDARFTATARGVQAAMVYLTQSISSVYAAMGGPDARASADSLLAGFQTTIFHAQGDSVTCEWAERKFAKDLLPTQSTGLNSQSVFNRGMQESLRPVVLAKEFATLKKGGPENSGVVEAIVFQTGRRWDANCSNVARIEFRQSDEKE
ncbi:MAG: hypothetical protein IPK83_21245 [Planctomycetes bacterium]|nr:hypothetical protein [Planctomycetota bacterium]